MTFKKLLTFVFHYLLVLNLPIVSASDEVIQETSVSSSVLVSVDWLSVHRTDANIRVIELGKTDEAYRSGHIPQALFVDWLEITDPAETERYNVLPREMLEALLSRLGIGNQDTIILYDDLNSRIATRTFWTLRYYGHKEIRILNGGRQKWIDIVNNLSTDIPVIEPTDYQVAHINSSYRVEMEFIKSHLDDPQVALIDGRPSSQYSGEIAGVVFHTGQTHKRKGHIPGAINVFWKNNFNDDGTFKSLDELRQLYESKGMTADKTIVTYCNEGLHASPPWFVLKELFGYPQVRLYDDSMSQWANRDDTPMEMSN